MRQTFLLFALVATQVSHSSAIAGPSIVFDLSTHNVIDEYNAGQPWYPASLTKMMTAYLTFSALREGRLQLDQVTEVSKAAASEPASKIGLKPGDKITIDKALQATLVYSANDMAVVLAEAVGGTSAAFIENMNNTAARLGMSATQFDTANGLHSPTQVTTARDMAVLTAALLETFPEYRHYFSQASVEFGEKSLRNRNALLRLMPEADGMKTGFTCNSGFNLAASATSNGRTIIAIVFGAPDWQTRANWSKSRLRLAFRTPQQNTKIEDVLNVKLLPPDLREEVCLGKGKQQLTPISNIAGWGISSSIFVSYSDAEQAFHNMNVTVPGSDSGVVKLPLKEGYIVSVWSLDAETSRKLCLDFTSKHISCEVINPDQIAKLKKIAATEDELAQRQIPKKNRHKVLKK